MLAEAGISAGRSGGNCRLDERDVDCGGGACAARRVMTRCSTSGGIGATHGRYHADLYGGRLSSESIDVRD